MTGFQRQDFRLYVNAQNGQTAKIFLGSKQVFKNFLTEVTITALFVKMSAYRSNQSYYSTFDAYCQNCKTTYNIYSSTHNRYFAADKCIIGLYYIN